MKFIVLALFCSVAFAAAQLEPEAYYGSPRVRRQDRGSLVIHGEKPMSGPDRRPSLDVDYHQRVFDRNGMTANTYGGLNIRPGQPPQPHAGIQLQRNFKDGFIGGFGQVQRRPGGGPSPTFGISGGYRFRRDVDEPVDDEIAPQY